MHVHLLHCMHSWHLHCVFADNGLDRHQSTWFPLSHCPGHCSWWLPHVSLLWADLWVLCFPACMCIRSANPCLGCTIFDCLRSPAEFQQCWCCGCSNACVCGCNSFNATTDRLVCAFTSWLCKPCRRGSGVSCCSMKCGGGKVGCTLLQPWYCSDTAVWLSLAHSAYWAGHSRIVLQNGRLWRSCLLVGMNRWHHCCTTLCAGVRRGGWTCRCIFW